MSDVPEYFVTAKTRLANLKRIRKIIYVVILVYMIGANVTFFSLLNQYNPTPFTAEETYFPGCDLYVYKNKTSPSGVGEVYDKVRLRCDQTSFNFTTPKLEKGGDLEATLRFNIDIGPEFGTFWRGAAPTSVTAFTTIFLTGEVVQKATNTSITTLDVSNPNQKYKYDTPVDVTDEYGYLLILQIEDKANINETKFPLLDVKPIETNVTYTVEEIPQSGFSYYQTIFNSQFWVILGLGAVVWVISISIGRLVQTVFEQEIMLEIQQKNNLM